MRPDDRGTWRRGRGEETTWRRSDEKRLREKERENGEDEKDETGGTAKGARVTGRTQWRGCTESYGYR